MKTSYLIAAVAGIALGYVLCNKLRANDPWKTAYAKGSQAV